MTELWTPVNQQKILSFRPVIKALFDPLGAHWLKIKPANRGKISFCAEGDLKYHKKYLKVHLWVHMSVWVSIAQNKGPFEAGSSLKN